MQGRDMTTAELIRSVAFGLRLLGRNELEADAEAKRAYYINQRKRIPDGYPVLQKQYDDAEQSYWR